MNKDKNDYGDWAWAIAGIMLAMYLFYLISNI